MKTKCKLSNRILSLVLAFVMVAGLMPMTALAVNTLQQDSDGYYLIANENDLFEFAQIVNGNHSSIAKNTSANGKLTADIAMTGSSKPWTPIASSDYNADAYTGTFDGQGHTISNLYFNDATAFNAGLFGYVYGGTIRNVTVADSYVAAIWSGAIAGRFFGDGRIEGCGNLNTTVVGGNAGGIVGNSGSAVIACWNTGKISATGTWAGGICGYLQGSVKGCWNTGEITGERCGGIVSSTSGSRTVVYCYNDGMVKAGNSDYEGAIVGSSNGGSDPKMENCYYTWPLGGASQAYGEGRDSQFTSVDDVSSSMLPTGEGALFLNQGLAGTGYQYYQNLDSGSPDAYPVLSSSHGTVYKGYKACSDVISYSNAPLSATIYHSGVTYQAAIPTVREVCTNANCTISVGLGSVTLQAADTYYYTGSPIPNPVTGSFKNGATYNVTYNGSETVPSQVGHYTAKLTVYEDGAEMGTVSADYDIRYLPSPGIDRIGGSGYENNGIYWFKDGAVAEVIAPEGYGISTALNGDYTGSVSFSQSDAKTVYLKRVSGGAMTDAIDLSGKLKWDTTAPEGRVQLSTGNFWTNLINKISFDLFFKEDKTVTITAQDTDSGVKSIQYYYYYEDLINDDMLDSAAAIAKLEDAVGNDWEDYSRPIELWQDGKYIVYAKLTDNVGNVTYLSSDGFVLYSDAASTTTSLTATYKAGEGRDISLALNGNTVNEVQCGNASLAGTDYTVSGGKITLESEYLDTLAAGDYTITVSLNPQGVPYVEAANNDKPLALMVNLTVKQRQVAVPAEDPTSFVYNGGEQTYGITPSDWYTVTGNKQSFAGTYTVTVSLKDKDNTVWADGTTEDKTYTFHIAKATYDMTGAKWDYTGSFQYDGKAHKVEVIGLPGGVTASGYNGNTATVVGNYTAKVTLSYDSNNYNAPYVADLNWKIENNWTPTEYTVSTPNGNGWLNNDFVITAADGYKVSLTNTADGEWRDSLAYSGETADGSVTFYLKNGTDGPISLAKPVSYKLDKTAPTGKVEFVERSGWGEFVNAITFGVFYKDEVTVKVTANDNLSSVAKIEYASSDKAMTLDEVKAITDWTEYAGSFGVALEDAKKFVYFIRITDQAGNAAYLSTDGAEYDTMAPVVSGIENGKTYYTTQKVTVTDKNLDAVTLNGTPVIGTITLEGNKDAAYTIAATDKAGNTTTVTVTMKPIKELAKATENLGNGNVTSDDAPALKELAEKLDELIADPDTSDDGERETLEQHKVIAESLLQTIEDAAKATDTENTKKVKDITAENVTPEAKTDLEKAKADLEKALESGGGNYTEGEKKAIQDELGRIEDALAVIGKVEAVEDKINDLPSTIKKDDEPAIQAADDAWSALSDYEKSLVDEDAKKALADAKAALAELNKPADTTSPSTGDNRSMFLWIALLFTSGAAAILIAIDRKKQAKVC